jgi:tetratricopeptide (TPR) repeat protein
VQKQTLAIQQAIDLAVQHHTAGDLPKAEAIYQRILQADPDQPVALHLLGLIAHQVGKNDTATDLITKAITIKPDFAEAHSSLGLSFKALGQLDKAAASYNKAIAINPGYAEAHSNLGNALQELGLLNEAMASYRMALSIKFDFPEAHNNQGNVLQKLGELGGAVESFNKAIAIKPDYAEAHYNLGNTHQDLGQLYEAVGSYNKALAIKCDYAEAYNNLGSTLNMLKQLDEAVACYSKAITIKHDYAEAHSNLGIVFNELGRLDEAIVCYNKAIAIKPDYEEMHSNLGNTFKELGRLDEAVSCHKKALAIKPDFAMGHYNLGVALSELKHLDEALASYDKAISIEPNYAEAYWNKSLTLLLCGDFENGWKLYEWRWKNENGDSFKHKRTFTQPLWLGAETLKDKIVLLHSEQGLGDTIQFFRYAKLVKALGARVIMEVPKPLVSLLQGLGGVDELVEKGEPLPYFDYYCPLMSLPLAFKTELNTIPSLTSYLQSDNKKVAKWKERLGEKTSLRIGLVWNGSAEFIKYDYKRSITLDALMKYLPDQFEYVCLQNKIRDTDKDALKKSTIKYFGAEINDFTENAALCEVMDLVISVDTSVAHLSGALGKPTWVLLPYVPDWRWMLDRDDSPWYGSTKLYRQFNDRKWEPVLQRLVEDLINWYDI